jgi:hypothetical protein
MALGSVMSESRLRTRAGGFFVVKLSWITLKRAVEKLAAKERKEHKARKASKGRISLCSVRSFAAIQSSPNW